MTFTGFKFWGCLQITKGQRRGTLFTNEDPYTSSNLRLNEKGPETSPYFWVLEVGLESLTQQRALRT